MKPKNLLILNLLLFAFITATQSCDGKTPKETILRTSYVEVDKIRDVSMHGGRIKRIVAHIVIPLGRTEEEVRATLKRAAIEIGTRERAKATTVKGYRPQDKIRSGVFTAGQATYAPNGKWGDASIKAPMAVNVEFSKDSLYFKKDEPPTKTEEEQDIILTSENGKPIDISRNRDSWSDEDIIAKIPSGTRALVLQRHKEVISPEMLFIRCRVRVHWKGKIVEGWVHGWDIGKK
jgi:hypothetical protein